VLDSQPGLFYGLIGARQFYGDPNTRHGDLCHRSFLSDNWGGLRDKLVEDGIYLNVYVDQFLAENIKGGKRRGRVRYNGTSDYWLFLDTCKLGLWSDGALMFHAETSWRANKSINPDVASLVPPNTAATMPVPNKSTTTLSEFYWLQALSEKYTLIVGKMNCGTLADENIFANNSRIQFNYAGLDVNPILGAFIPYTPLGTCVLWTPNPENNVIVSVFNAEGNAEKWGFDTLFNGETTYGVQYTFSPTVCGKLPGNYLILYAFSSKKATDYAIDPRHLIEEITGLIPIETKPNNYTIVANFDQYLWVKGGSAAAYKQRMTACGIARKNLPPEGIGIFGRIGWAPKDRNVIDQFYSLGIGGYGMIFPNRHYDRWGVGYAATHISADFRRDAKVMGMNLNRFEHGVEAFYNFQLVPYAHLTLNMPIIKSPVSSRRTAFALGLRLEVDL